ncbi:MAG TPA: DNA repair protein RadA [Candidatus Saccharimonadales bacterium]
MARGNSVVYVCSNCGGQTSSWSGRCPHCQEWNTLEEKVTSISSKTASSSRALAYEPINQSINDKQQRLKTNIADVDNVLGGGIVKSSINLIAGQPGIGKSTILMQIAAEVAKTNKTLYVSGEESLEQIALRAKRLGIKSKSLELASSNSTDDILSTISSKTFDLIIIDSIQTISTADIASAPGSVAQITNSTALISSAAKQTDTAIILVGHVTKEGYIAGPKILEHLVDVVLQLEGDKYGGFKILRATKNRFGSINDTGIFEMTDTGLMALDNPSETLLSERQVADGSIVHATIEGNRPLLVEIQALVNTSNYGYPKRTASGFDLNRLNLLVAMMEKRTKLKLSDKDIYINVVGGIQLKEPASDLAICMAIASATTGHKLKSDLVVFGELGLSGEVRRVPFAAKRLAEAKKLGFKGAIGPEDKTVKEAGLNSVKQIRQALIDYLEKS